MSLDTFDLAQVAEAFADIPLAMPPLHIADGADSMSVVKLADYHINLWRGGQTRLAVTYYLSVYKQLKAAGVPAFRVIPTRDSIRALLDTAMHAAEAHIFKSGQIAIQHLAIDGYTDFVRKAVSSYAVKRVELVLYEILVDYTEQCKGSIVIHGNGQYTLYTTRGIVRNHPRFYRHAADG